MTAPDARTTGSWLWRCSACPETFTGATRDEAEGKFLAHARTRHNAKTILSTTTEAR